MTFDRFFKGSGAKRLTIVCLGATLYGASLGLLLAPNGIAPGGTGGIAIMLSGFFPLGVGGLNMLLNLPLLIIAILKWGWKFLFSTTAAIAVSGITADAFSFFTPLSETPLLAAVFGGAAMGAGCGIVFRAGSTTGGTDIVTRLLKLKYPHLKIGTIILIIDGIISILSGFVYADAENAMYSLIALAVCTKTIDLVIYGTDSAKLIIVISDKSREITDGLLHKVDVGCTVLKGVSGFKRQESEIILCAMKKQLFPAVRDYILKADSKAFILVSGAGEIFGEGFKTELSDFF